MDDKIKRPKRLILEVSDFDHAEVKRRATDKNISITKWLIEAIKLLAEQEDKDK